jgi:hypothetical protein
MYTHLRGVCSEGLLLARHWGYGPLATRPKSKSAEPRRTRIHSRIKSTITDTKGYHRELWVIGVIASNLRKRACIRDLHKAACPHAKHSAHDSETSPSYRCVGKWARRRWRGLARQPSSAKEASAGISALRRTPALIWGLSSCRTCTGNVDEGAAHTIRKFMRCALRRESVTLTYLSLLMQAHAERLSV